jgi:CheY-like chemotaxis protein
MRYSRPNLLLVDDCVAERDLYELLLTPQFNVLTASRGSDGVNIAVRERPDAIVMDVLMPGMDGWAACTYIKCHPATADIPVILLTGADDRDLTQHAIAVGATAVLNKPCHADTLIDAIRRALSEPGSPERSS